MAFQTLVCVVLALAASSCQAATVAVGVQNLEVHSPKGSASSKRLMRSDTDARLQEEVALAADAEIPKHTEELEIGSVLDRTIHTLHNNREAVFPASLLAAKGPQKLDGALDAWNASLSAMKKLSSETSIDCAVMYGEQMLENLMSDRSVHHLCTGKSSTLTCHEREPFDVPRYMCELKGVMISAQGTSVTGCNKPGDFKEFFKNQGITENNIFGSYTKFGGLNEVTGDLSCASHAGSKAVVQVPCNTGNFYEWYGDWVTLWETVAAMQWHPKDVELYLVGDISDKNKGKQFKRPFDEAWSHAFKAENVHVGSYSDLFGEGICFPQLVTAPQGALSTMTFRGGRGGVVGCSAPTLAASALFLQAIFPPPAPPPTATSKTLTLLLRKGLRKFENDNSAIETVREVLPKDWTLRLYRPENMTSLAEQLSIAGTTQVLVGVHGAGMMHVLFLPPKARVVEIFCEDRPRGNRHFQNLENMAEPAAHPHLFSYYFDAASARCKIDQKAVGNAIKAFDDAEAAANTAANTPKLGQHALS